MAVGLVAVASLILLLAQRGRNTIAILNGIAAVIIVVSLSDQRDFNAALARVRGPLDPRGPDLYMMGFDCFPMLAGALLNIVSSFIQPPYDD
jgi:hypothetical protein